MEIVKFDGKVYRVLGDSGKKYDVVLNPMSCSCPHFQLRLKGRGMCKHLLFIIEEVKCGMADSYVLKWIKEGNDDAVDFVKMFSEQTLDILKARGEVFEKRGKLVVIE